MTATVATRPAREARAEPGTALEAIVEARAVDKLYDTGKVQVHALRGVSFSVSRGEMVAIMGPSGSGKTTLLNCLSGLDRIDAGEVLIEGVALSALSDEARTDYRARRMGFVFQFYNLIPVLSAVENVELPLLVARVPAKEARRKALAALDLVGLGERAAHVPDELSGGQRQRVTIARALVNDPAIVWADEPTGDLDSENAEEIVALMRRLNREQGPDVPDRDPRHLGGPGHRPHRADGRRRDRGRRAGRAMTRIFGLPVTDLAVILTVLLVLALAGITVLALRNKVFFRLGIRSLTRRRGRTALIVVGLMLGTTIISAALATGDTMSHTIRSSATAALGQTDEVVGAKGIDAALASEKAGRLDRLEVLSAGLRGPPGARHALVGPDRRASSR